MILWLCGCVGAAFIFCGCFWWGDYWVCISFFSVEQSDRNIIWWTRRHLKKPSKHQGRACCLSHCYFCQLLPLPVSIINSCISGTTDCLMFFCFLLVSFGFYFFLIFSFIFSSDLLWWSKHGVSLFISAHLIFAHCGVHVIAVPIDRTGGINMLYVFVDIKIDSLHFIESLQHNFAAGTHLALVSTIQFVPTLQVPPISHCLLWLRLTVLTIRQS